MDGLWDWRAWGWGGGGGEDVGWVVGWLIFVGSLRYISLGNFAIQGSGSGNVVCLGCRSEHGYVKY